MTKLGLGKELNCQTWVVPKRQMSKLFLCARPWWMSLTSVTNFSKSSRSRQRIRILAESPLGIISHWSNCANSGSPMNLLVITHLECQSCQISSEEEFLTTSFQKMSKLLLSTTSTSQLGWLSRSNDMSSNSSWIRSVITRTNRNELPPTVMIGQSKSRSFPLLATACTSSDWIIARKSTISPPTSCEKVSNRNSVLITVILFIGHQTSGMK